MATPRLPVLVLTSLTGAQYERVRAADARVRLRDGAALLIREIPDALRPGQQQPPLREAGATLDGLLAEAEIILGARRIPLDLAKRAPKLRWLQMPIAGLDGTGVEGLWWEARVAITSAAGFNARPVAEYAIMAALMMLKDARRILRSQEARRWDRFDLGQLRGKTLAVIGYGTVGREVARLAEPFGVRLLAVKRVVSPGEGLPEWVHPADRLEWVLAQADVVALCVPATAETRGMLDARRLGLLKSGALLINVSRWDVVDEGALVDALRGGRLAGAALDVFNQEPLLPDSPLWTLPNTIVSGHVAGLFQGFDDAVLDIFVENLGRYLDGRPLLNLLDPSAGY